MKRATSVTVWRRTATALAVAILALGCLGRSPGVRQYTLGSVPGGASAGSAEFRAGSAEFGVALGPVTFPPYLQRPQLVTRNASSELFVDARNRWAGGFEANVLRALADDLSARLGTPWVVVAPEDAPLPPAYRIAVDFLRFEGQPGAELVLRARWVIREQEGDRVWSGGGAIRRPLADEGTESLVAAHEAALGELADAIAAPLAEARRSPEGSPVGSSR